MRGTFLICLMLIVFIFVATNLRSQSGCIQLSANNPGIRANNGSYTAMTEMSEHGFITTKRMSPDSDVVNHPPDQHNYVPKNETVILGFTTGYCSAAGNFASRSFTNGSTSTHSVKGGFSYQLSAILKLSRYFGLRAAYDYQSFRIDHKAVEKYFSTIYAGLNFESSSTDWLVRGFSVGAFGTVKTEASPRAFVDFDLSIAKYTITSPQTQIIISNGGASGVFRQESAEAKSWGFTVGVGFHYHINPAAALVLRSSYLSCLPVYSANVQANGTSTLPGNDYTILIESASIQAGLAIIIR